MVDIEDGHTERDFTRMLAFSKRARRKTQPGAFLELVFTLVAWPHYLLLRFTRCRLLFCSSCSVLYDILHKMELVSELIIMEVEKYKCLYDLEALIIKIRIVKDHF